MVTATAHAVAQSAARARQHERHWQRPLCAPLIGALIISLLPETFRGFKQYQDLAYGATLIVILIYAPKGLASLPRLFTRRRSH